MAEHACPICLGLTGLLLLVILLPLSISYIDYYDYGLKQSKISGKVDTTKVYTSGRYVVGPDARFLKYQASAHLIHLEELAVFSDGGADNVGLSFLIDVDFTYFLKEEEVGQLHRELAKNYEAIILSRTKDAIKNSATTVKFSDYFRERLSVEKQFFKAVQDRWDTQPSVHATLDKFHVGRIKIPEVVAQKQLSAKIQVEKNKEEEFLQMARIEREVTLVDVNRINLTKDKLLKKARAEANLFTANAVAEGERIKNDAINTGTMNLLDSIGITNEDHSTAFTYIRTLQNRKNLGLRVSYLSDENIVKTKATV